MLTRPAGLERQGRAVLFHIGADKPALSVDLQQSLELHVEEGHPFDSAILFANGGQGNVFIACDLVAHAGDPPSVSFSRSKTKA